MATLWNDLIAQFFDMLAIRDNKQMESIIKKLFSINYKKTEQILGRTFSSYADENGLLTYDKLFVHGRFEKLQNELVLAHKITINEVETSFDKKMDASIEQNFLGSMFFCSLFGLSFLKMTPKEFEKIKNVQWYAETWKKTLSRSGDDFSRTLMNTITVSTNEPINYKTLMKNVKKNFDTQVKKTLTVFTTENSRKQTDAITTAFSKVAKNGKINALYIWTATLDEKTCDVCGKTLDGTIVDPSFVKYPAHPNCRCVLVPKLDEFFDQISGRGFRDQEDFFSKYTNEKTFNDWLVSLPKHTELSKKNAKWIKYLEDLKK